MGKGLAALTFDEEYQKKRRRGMNNKPANFHEGLARSGKGLVMVRVNPVTRIQSNLNPYSIPFAGLCGRCHGRGNQTCGWSTRRGC